MLEIIICIIALTLIGITALVVEHPFFFLCIMFTLVYMYKNAKSDRRISGMSTPLEAEQEEVKAANTKSKNDSDGQDEGLLIKGIIIPQKIIEKMEEKAGFYIKSEEFFLIALSKILGVSIMPSLEEMWPDAKTIKMTNTVPNVERKP